MENRLKVKMFSEYREWLCEQYTVGTTRKCFGMKCPLAKFGCYNYVTYTQMYENFSAKKREELLDATEQSMEATGWI